MIKRRLALILSLCICLALTACGSSNGTAEDTGNKSGYSEASGTAEPSDGATIIWKDDAGRDVEIPSDITRILPSGPVAQIVLYAIAPEKMVGLATKWNEEAAEIIPEEYYDLPYFGQFYGSVNMNIEELAVAAPDLVIDIGEAKDSSTENLDNFTLQTGIPIVFVKADLANMDQTFTKLGLLLGKKAEALADFCAETYSRTEEIMNRVGNQKVKTLYVQGGDGRNVLAQGSYHAQLLDVLTENVAVLDDPSNKGLGNEVSLEQIALWNPDFVIFGANSIYETADEIPGWKEVSAIAKGNYVEAPDNPYCWMGTPPSVQRYLALIWLPSVLYPEYCDYDIKEEVLEYYRLFYHCNLTDVQYDQLTEKAWAFPKE